MVELGQNGPKYTLGYGASGKIKTLGYGNLAKNRPLAMEIGLKKGPLRHPPPS